MNWEYRTIMSGHRRDPWAVAMRVALRAAAWPYAMAVRNRNYRYDTGKNGIHNMGVPVISIGNLTTGGTGKTPIVCLVAKWFRSNGVRVAIVSRGYGRDEGGINDEAMELHDRLPDVPHVQDPDRVEAARIAVEELEAEVILMDDGFQHRRLHRDLDIVVIDATCPFGYGYTLPRGLLREPVDGLVRADFVILTRCDAVSEETLVEIEKTVHRIEREIQIYRSSHHPTGLREHPCHTLPIDSLSGKNVAVISAIGNPDAFEHTVRSCGANAISSKQLPDHDPYSPDTVAQLREWIRGLGDSIDQVVCTHKDLVKLQSDRIGGKPLGAIIIELEIDGDLTPWLIPFRSPAPSSE